jgi:hypothetical protein
MGGKCHLCILHVSDGTGRITMSFLIEKDQTRLLASLFLFLEKIPPDRQSRLVFFVSLKNARQTKTDRERQQTGGVLGRIFY